MKNFKTKSSSFRLTCLLKLGCHSNVTCHITYVCVFLSSDAGKLLILNNTTSPQQCSNLSRKSHPVNKEPLANKKSSAGPTMRSNYFFVLLCGRPLKILIRSLVIVNMLAYCNYSSNITQQKKKPKKWEKIILIILKCLQRAS